MPDDPGLDAAPLLSHRIVQGADAHAIFFTDPEGRILTWNPGVAGVLGYEEAEWVGRSVALLYTPEDREASIPERQMRDALAAGRAEDERWHLRKDGVRVFAHRVVSALRDESGAHLGFAHILQDATERHRLQSGARASEERMRLVIDAFPSLISYIGTDLCYRFGNRAYREWFGADPETIAGRHARDVVGEETFRRRLPQLEAALRGEVVRFEGTMHHRSAGLRDTDTSYVPDRGEGGEVRGLFVLVQDISERKAAERSLARSYERERLVNAIGNAIRRSGLDPSAIQNAAVAALGQALGADRCYYVSYDQARDASRIGPEWHRDGLPPVAGDYRMSAFAVNREVGYRRGRTQVVEDVRQHVVGPAPDPMEALGLRALLRAPLRSDGPTATALVAAMADGPRRWSDDEVRLVETVAAQTYAALEAAAVVAREHERAEREALLNRIGAAIRATLDPEEVQAAAVALLGEALGADRCYFNTYDPVRPVFHIGRDWRRPDLPPMEGEYVLSDFSGIYGELYTPGGLKTTVYEDVLDSPLSDESKKTMARYQLRSFVGVALLDEDGGIVAQLRAAMADGPRAWTAEEVGLVESVATLLRTALESARVQRRERNIAQQLQAALLPPVPSEVPGLKLCGFYRAALEEAEVGGDFSDVFPVRRGESTCLVLADLSGKGLAAASQVATLRNMLRLALHSDGPLAATLSGLNRVLVEQDLLAGFATVLVGAYDAAARRLRYVNCGQEPGLLWRAATGVVEQLPPTAPVLGAFAEGAFEEGVVTLAPGDMLLLVTDGMTEVGPTRRRFLEIDGLAELFALCAATERDRGASQDPDQGAASVVARLMAGAEAHAGGAAGFRDDIALLVAVAAPD